MDADKAPECNLAREAGKLPDVLDFERLNQKQQGRWQEFVDEVTTYSPGAPLTPAVAYFLPKLLDAYDDMLAGEATITVFRKQALTATACESLCRIVRTIVGREIENKLRQTRGIWRVLDQYEQAYRRLVRSRSCVPGL